MMPTLRSMLFAVVAAGAPALWGAAAPGVAPPAPSTPAPPWSAPPPQIEGATLVNGDPVEISRYLGTVYKREADGFRLAPPAGSQIIQRGPLDLVSFLVSAKGWGGALQRVTDPAASVAEFVVAHRKSIVEDWSFRGVQFLEEKALRQGSYPAVRLSFSVEVTPATQPGKPGTPVSLLRQELIVQVKDHQYMVLTLYAPLRDKVDAIRTFDLMIPELEIFDATTVEKRVAAGALGKKWLAQQSAEQFRAKIIGQPQYFRILVGGQDVGYLRFDEMLQEPGRNGGAPVAVERDGRKGVLLQANVRSFPADGSIVYAQNEAFWAFSKDASDRGLQDYFTWHNVSKTKATIAASPAEVRQGLPALRKVEPWLDELGVVYQSGDPTDAGKPHRLVVTLSGDDSQSLAGADQQLVGLGPQRGVSVTPRALPGIDQVIPIEAPAPLPKILEYSWTRFVDLTKPSEMSFSVFNSDPRIRKPALRNLIVTGQKEVVKIDGNPITCYKCVDELDPNSTTIWTDKDGRIQMMRTNDQSVMIPTTEAAMTAKWAGRLKDQ